ncbi:MAG TPA: hypothetical protein DCW44_00435 [Eubacterium sp.]|nr:hypothetical protein [Eubacterium sp.]
MQKLICDRCGETIKPFAVSRAKARILEKRYIRDDKQIDLCEKCTRKLYLWYNRPTKDLTIEDDKTYEKIVSQYISELEYHLGEISSYLDQPIARTAMDNREDRGYQKGLESALNILKRVVNDIKKGENNE